VESCLCVRGQSDEVVADIGSSTLDDPRCDTAETPNSIVTAHAEYLFHSRTRMTLSRRLQNGGAQPEALLFESKQVDTPGNDIAPQICGQNLIAAQMTGDSCQVLSLDQSNLAAAGRASVTIADKPSFDMEIYALDRQHGFSAAGADTKPNNLPRSHLCIQKLRERG